MLKDTIKAINKEYGDGTSVNLNFFDEEHSDIIPVTPKLDIILGKGVPEGSWFILTGPPKAGKTSLALHFARKACMPCFGNRDIVFINAEARLKERDIAHLDFPKEKFNIIQSSKEKILSAQEQLNIMYNILCQTEKCVMIVDSFSRFAHSKELAEGIGTSTRGGTAGLLSQFCTSAASVVTVKKHIVIGITHIMANTSGYGKAIMEKGGYALGYQADVKLRVKTWARELDKEKPIGQRTTWECETNALNAAPGQTAETFLRYGIGMDEVTELIELAADVGIISKAGAWYTLTFMSKHTKEYNEKEFKFQGVPNCRQHLIDHPDQAAHLYSEVMAFYWGEKNEKAK